ncbi:hypothetical protein [uncultured Roseobacter sp.]|uniref:hypothetical protein n=1 Tax=uncultured Roseobacter sp. TaxID=114847 RepID=UPI002620E3A9|nr:hypothetical protein [uncultured Roseobacter sp.]
MPLRAARRKQVYRLFEHAMISAVIIMADRKLRKTRALCHRLRKLSTTLPILVVLGAAQESGGIELLESGADHYAVEPLEVEKLLMSLTAISRRQPGRTNPNRHLSS